MVHVQDLILDHSIDNSLSQSLSFYSLAPTAPPYPSHLFSPYKTESGSFSLTGEINSRIRHLEDDFTDTVTATNTITGDITLHSPRGSFDCRSKSDMSAMNSLNSLFRVDDELSLNKYIAEIGETGKEETDVGSRTVQKKTSKQKMSLNVRISMSKLFLYLLTLFPFCF